MELKQTYEKIVPVANEGRHRSVRIAIFIGYVAFALLWVAPIIRSLFSPLLIALAALLETVLVLCTKKYLNVEYEYFFGGESLTVSTIFAKKSRKTLLKVDLKDMLFVAPCNEDTMREAERFDPQKTVDATGSADADDVLMVIFDKDADTRMLLFLESDGQIVAQFRRYAPHACSRELRSNLR